jgi:hypothetical protein
MKMTLVIGLALFGTLGCGGDTAPLPPISVTFKNSLARPITVSAEGTASTLVTNQSTIVFPGGTTTVTWTEQRPTYSDGTPIPDDLGSTSILVADKATLTVSNVVGTTTYFAPFLTNSTGVAVAVAIVHAGDVRCLGTQVASASGVTWGYYALLPQTEFRIYAGASKCTGTYRYWDVPAIQGGMFSGGLVLLEPTTPP